MFKKLLVVLLVLGSSHLVAMIPNPAQGPFANVPPVMMMQVYTTMHNEVQALKQHRSDIIYGLQQIIRDEWQKLLLVQSSMGNSKALRSREIGLNKEFGKTQRQIQEGCENIARALYRLDLDLWLWVPAERSLHTQLQALMPDLQNYAVLQQEIVRHYLGLKSRLLLRHATKREDIARMLCFRNANNFSKKFFTDGCYNMALEQVMALDYMTQYLDVLSFLAVVQKYVTLCPNPAEISALATESINDIKTKIIHKFHMIFNSNATLFPAELVTALENSVVDILNGYHNPYSYLNDPATFKDFCEDIAKRIKAINMDAVMPRDNATVEENIRVCVLVWKYIIDFDDFVDFTILRMGMLPEDGVKSVLFSAVEGFIAQFTPTLQPAS